MVGQHGGRFRSRIADTPAATSKTARAEIEVSRHVPYVDLSGFIPAASGPIQTFESR